MSDEADGSDTATQLIISCVTGLQYEGTADDMADDVAQMRADDAAAIQELINDSLRQVLDGEALDLGLPPLEE